MWIPKEGPLGTILVQFNSSSQESSSPQQAGTPQQADT